MKVILRERVANLGDVGQVVNVRPGYARNYLLPRNLAVAATKNNLKRFEHEKRLIEMKRQKRRKEALELKQKLEKVSCSIAKKVGEQDKLFGAVTAADIQVALEKEGFKVDKKDILLEEPIKALGVYTVKVRLFEDVVAEAKVWVVKQ